MAELHVPDRLKMLRETFCVAQTWAGQSGDSRSAEHVARLGRLIADIDRQRPLEQNGDHKCSCVSHALADNQGGCVHCGAAEDQFCAAGCPVGEADKEQFSE
jgi:hypothetical protein